MVWYIIYYIFSKHPFTKAHGVCICCVGFSFILFFKVNSCQKKKEKLCTCEKKEKLPHNSMTKTWKWNFWANIKKATSFIL